MTNKRILVIGDSHTNAFMDKMSNSTGGYILSGNVWTKHETLNMYMNRIGPYLAFNVLNKMSILTEELKNIQATANDVIILSFGEIDCRAHLRNRCLEDFSNADEVVTMKDDATAAIKTKTYKGKTEGESIEPFFYSFVSLLGCFKFSFRTDGQ